MKNNLARLLAVLMLALTAVTGSAVAASASPGDHLVAHRNDQGGLGGTLSYADVLGNRGTLTAPSVRRTYGYGNDAMRFVFAGGGYCVNEKSYYNDGSANPAVTDRNYGKNFSTGVGAPANTRYEIRGNNGAYLNGGGSFIQTDLRIFRC